MAREGRVSVVFTGDDDQLQRTFDDVGAGARDMANDVGKQAKRMSDDLDKGSHDIAGAIDESEGKFRGLGDTIGGTGDIMQGFKDGNIAGIAMGFADLAGGITQFVVPAITAMKSAILTGLAPALTAISAHPLIAGILIGGAIIAGLILLEKKFGVVSGAINFVKEHALDPLWGAFMGVFNWFRDTFGGIVDFITKPFREAFNLVARAWNATVGKLNFTVPDWVPGLGGKGWGMPNLPTFHSGGVVGGVPGEEVMAVLQAGETVLPRGRGAGGGGIVINVAGSVITERDLGRIVADALRQNRLIGVTA